MKVLHLYAGNLYGGIEAMLATIARHRGADPETSHEFGLCFPGRLRDELTAAGATVHDLGAVRFSRPWTVTLARRRLAALLRGGSFDAVVTHACWPHAVFAKVVRKFASVRLVNWVHDALQGDHWLDRLAAATPPDLVIANSSYSAACVAKVFPGVTTRLLRYPVDHRVAERSIALRSELGASDSTVAFLMASRMESWKGHAALLDALARLPKSLDWVAWVAGGAQRDAERAYLAELGVRAASLGIADRVRFLGQRSDVPELMASADVFCQPNTGPEPFGIVFVEALYAGLPVVTSDFGGGAEVVTPECGLLVPPGDAARLAEALAALAADAGLRKRLGAAGSARAVELCDPVGQLRGAREAIAISAVEAVSGVR